MRDRHTLTIPDTLDPKHAAILRDCHFVTVGALGFIIRNDTLDGIRVIYAITNPEQTKIVYVGDSEQGRDVRGRLGMHLNARDKMGYVEKNSIVFVHVMVTEYLVLDRFQFDTGALPRLNKTKTAKHTTNRAYKVNDLAAAKASAALAKARRAKITAPPEPAKTKPKTKKGSASRRIPVLR